jgi:Ca-activated chloride channel family protein
VTQLFDHPWMLLGALVAALAAAGSVLAGHARRRTRLARFGSPEALARLAPQGTDTPPWWRSARLGLAALLLAVAVAGPRWGASELVVESEGIDVVIALDVSLSMLAEDERPSRLERMKQEVRRLRASAPGDRVSLIAFAGRSYLLTPLTSDDGAIELFLENLDPSVVGQPGSSLAPPLRQGLDVLAAAPGGADRALVVMSDGEAFDDRAAAITLAEQALADEVHLVTVGFGTAGGAPIPLPATGGADVKRDTDGRIVVTQYDEGLLRAVAAAAEGVFIPAEMTDKGTRVRRALSDLESVRRAERLRQARPPRFALFVLAAILLLLVDAWRVDGGRLPWTGVVERRFRRSGAALAMFVAVAPALGAQPTAQDAIDHHRAGRLLPAIHDYRAAIAAGDRRPVVLFDLGTALLAADSLDAAIEALERATYLPDAEVRRRARYNLGLAYLKRGLRLDGEAQGKALEQARREFRTLLLERPGDKDVQWNYELALHAPTGGGGGNAPPPPGRPDQPPPPSGQMTRQQAEALLEAAAREERETQARRQRGERQTRAPGTRDW